MTADITVTATVIIATTASFLIPLWREEVSSEDAPSAEDRFRGGGDEPRRIRKFRNPERNFMSLI